MPPVGVALGAIGTAIGGALTVGAPLAGTGLLAGAAMKATIGGIAVKAFTQLAAGVALSALSAALQPKPGVQGTRGTRVQISTGEDAPQSFILGRHVTAGDLVYHSSWGAPGDTPNEYYSQVIELSDWPSRLRRVWVNGEWVDLKGEDPVGRGRAVAGYEKKSRDRLFVKFYDGTQTAADPYLVSRFGSDPQEPWTADMIGRGVTYMVGTAGAKDDVHRVDPQYRVELDGLHYDPRRDSTAGGSGAQRWGDWRTWEPSTNLVVLIYNVMRGIHDPVTGEHVWGGREPASAFPVSVWFAAMNACDVEIDVGGGATEPTYQGGLEVRVDEEPAAIVEELLKACEGQIADLGTHWHIRVGAPSAPVATITAEDVIVTEPATFEPFVGLDQTYNGVAARYPDPESGWEVRDAPLVRSDRFQEEDGGRRSIADLSLPAVFSGTQVQRLQEAGLKDHRRMRCIVRVLPPDFRPLAPLDEVIYHEPSLGFVNALFSAEMVEDLSSGCKLVAMRERDPDDYDPPSEYLPLPVTPGQRPPLAPMPVAGFAVEGAVWEDSGGRARASAIRLSWDPAIGDDVDGILYRVRLRDRPMHEPVRDWAPSIAGEEVEELWMALPGEPVMALPDEPVMAAYFDDPSAGAVLIRHGVVGGNWYQVDAAYDRAGNTPRWCGWMDVLAPVVGLIEDDFAEEFRDKIDTAAENAAHARDDVLEVKDRIDAVEETIDTTVAETLTGILDRVGLAEDEIAGIAGGLQAVEALVAGIDPDALSDLEALVDEIVGLGIGSVMERLDAAVQLETWLRDPTLAHWNASTLTHWSTTGITTWGAPVTGRLGGGLLIDAPSGATAIAISANLHTSGQLPAGNDKVEYVAVTIEARILSGDISTAALRVEWRDSASGNWVHGKAFDEASTLGRLAERWGFSVNPGLVQQRTVIFERPALSSNSVRLWLQVKTASPTNAVSMQVDFLGIRAATDAEIAAHLSAGYTDASIAHLEATIVGPGGAIATAVTALKSQVDDDIAAVNNTVLTAVDDLSALAGEVDAMAVSFGGSIGALTSLQTLLANDVGVMGGRLDTIEAQTGGTNLVKNPVFALDGGPLEPGVAPKHWVSWPSGFRVVQRDPGASTGAIRTAPAAFMVQVANDGQLYQAAAPVQFPVAPGERVAVAFTAAGGGSAINTSLQARMVWRDAAGTQVGPTDIRSVTITGTTWIETAFDPFISPADAASGTLFVRRPAGGAGAVFFTRVVCRQVDGVALAAAQSALGVATTASSAISQMHAETTARFGDYSTFVSQTASAVATAEGAQGALVFRVRDGLIGLYDWDNPNATGSAIRLDARHVLAPGTVSVGELVVMDHDHNIVPDPQLQSRTAWSGGNSGWSVILETSANEADSRGEIRWKFDPIGGPALCTGPEFTVRPNEVLTCSYQVGRIGGTKYRARAVIRFETRDRSSNTEVEIGDWVETTTTAIQSRTAQITVPSGMRRARWRWRVDGDNTDSDVRFWTPRGARRTDASVLITPDGAFMNMLTAYEAWIFSANIAEAQIGKLHLMDGAVGRLYSASSTTNANVGNPDEQTIVTVTIPSGVSGRALCVLNTAYRPTGTDQLEVTHRIRQNGIVRLSRVMEFGGSTDWKFPGWPVGLTVVPGDVITFSLHRTSGSGSGQIGHRYTDLGVYVTQR